ncbi:MAG: hypothetical protein KDD11_12955 [Acidobacteria bacterium]|nr:hypothetical protein [Acidobacteriota bacterium]
MKAISVRRALFFWLFSTLGSLLLATPAPAAQVHWLRTGAECAAPDPGGAVLVQACGAVGRYYLATTGELPAVECAAEVSGTEMAAFYARSNIGAPGTCFARDGGPWVAVADVRGRRSKEVGFTILQSSGGLVDVELLDLVAAHDRMPDRIGLPSDVHLLAVLCDLTESLDAGLDEPPVAVVVPFGRHLEAPLECSNDEAGLACQIERVLAHLATAHGTVTLAAAGDHRALTFPAAAPSALAVASLDPGRYLGGWGALPSWESPQATTALMPGIGVLLDLERADGLRPTPAGSPMATALFAGVLGGTLARGDWQPPVPFPLAAAWAPWPGIEGFSLALDGAPLPGSHFSDADLMIRRALGLVPAAPSEPPPTPETVLVLTADELVLPQQTLPGIIASLVDEWPPLPDVFPCVPCAGVRSQGPGGGRPDEPPGGDPPGDDPGPLVIDLSGSGSIGTYYDLEELALRVGDTVYHLEGGDDAALLAALGAGAQGAIAIDGVDLEAIEASGESMAMLFVLSYDGVPFWHSTPLQIGPPGTGP